MTNNPSAFPLENHEYWEPEPGMTLRDYFAGQALAGLLAHDHPDLVPREYASDAYRYADAMLQARERSNDA